MAGLLPSFHPEKLFLFEQHGKKLLVDRPSGLPQPVSAMAWDILRDLQEPGRLQEGSAEPTSEEGRRAVREIAQLVRSGHLAGSEPDVAAEDFCPTGLISVLLNLTHKCNLACGYCIMQMPALKENYQAPQKSMDEATSRQAIDFIRHTSLQGVTLTFFGGEPLLEFQIMQRLVAYAEEQYPDWFTWQVITNGTLLTPKMIQFFKKHRFSFLFSIDGRREDHDRLRVFKTGGRSVFDQAFTNLQLLFRAIPGCRCQVNATYFKPTLEIYEGLKFFMDAGVPHTRFDRGLVPRESPYAVTLADTEEIKRQFDLMACYYLEQLLAGRHHVLDPFVLYLKRISKKSRRYRVCNTGVDYITIAANGDIYSCYKLLGLEGQRLGSIWEGFAADAYRRIWAQNVLQRPKCKACWARFLCGGGCIADNYHLNGDFVDPAAENCEIMQHLIRLSLWLYAELEEKAPQILKNLLEDDYLLAAETPRRINDNIEAIPPGKFRNRRTGAVYELNGVAREIFDLCDGAHSIAAMARSLAATYGITEHLALSDVRSQVFRLKSADLVRTD